MSRPLCTWAPRTGAEKGSAYVSGAVDGAVTVGTSNDIIVTGDLTYASTANNSDDVVGLIPGRSAWVAHPVSSCSGCGPSSGLDAWDFTNLYDSGFSRPVTQIHAAVLTIKGSFILQNYHRGREITTSPATRLNVLGAIAQNFRGTVYSAAGSTESGYIKNYVYDDRFKRGIQPPYFIAPPGPGTIGQVSDG